MSMIGRTVGHYDVVTLLGRGGMGEVYQAKDLKLGRNVAIKVLPKEFAADADRVARFQREAKLLASLNHPNIASIYGLEESYGTHFLVLELIEGETLADRMKRGPIPVEECLKLALQIAQALEAAHDKGVIHRDLKPANIKISPDGMIKVLDFGLAKAFAAYEEVNLSNSPTLSDAATKQGIILGTAAYMSPEQAKGKAVDRRADVWAFGVVLFEMLTGRQLFTGETVSETLAAVLMREPDFSTLPSKLHPRIRLLLERCLEKQTVNRYGSINDARVDIQKVLADPSGVFFQPVAITKPRKSLRLGLSWFLAAIILTAIVAGAVVWTLKPVEPPRVIRFSFEIPENLQFSNLSVPMLAVSPDGKKFAFCARKGLYLHSMDELTPKLIAGDKDPQQPFFSPDGEWIGYFSENQLRKVAARGGASVTLCNVSNSFGAVWNADGTIVCGANGGIQRISAQGGTPEFILKTVSMALAAPQLLPNKKSVLFTNLSLQPPRIAVRTLGRGVHNELFAGNAAHYLPTGHLVYTAAGNLMAVPFDPDKFEVTGGSIPIIEGVLGPLYAVSDSGTLVYVPGILDTTAPGRTLVWIDRNGKEELLAAQPNIYRNPNISPDGTKVALSVAATGNSDIWIWDVVRKTLTRLSFEGSTNRAPVWSRDGKRIAFFSSGDRSNKNIFGVYWKAADGTGREELLASPAQLGKGFLPCYWSSDGKILVGEESTDGQHFDIGILSTEGDPARKSILQEDYLETQPRISPDGRWMAYTSGESHRNEVYVRSFPDVNRGRWQVSTSGGDSPLWSPDGRELFYRNGSTVMAVSVKTEPSFGIVGNPQTLFQGTYVGYSPNDVTSWDISPDGKRFLMIKPYGVSSSESEGPDKINVIVNWLEELKQRVPIN